MVIRRITIQRTYVYASMVWLANKGWNQLSLLLRTIIDLSLPNCLSDAWKGSVYRAWCIAANVVLWQIYQA